KAPKDKAKAPEDEPKTPEDEAKAPEDEAKAPEDEAKAPKEKAKALEPSGEASLLVLEKEAATVSDIQKEETRRQTKKNAAIVFAVERVSKQGNLLPHSILLLRETALPK